MDDYQQSMDILDIKEKAAILDALFEEKEFRQRIGNEPWGAVAPAGEIRWRGDGCLYDCKLLFVNC